MYKFKHLMPFGNVFRGKQFKTLSLNHVILCTFFQRPKVLQIQFLPELCKLLVSLIHRTRQVSPGKVYTSRFGQLGTGMTLINFHYWSRDMLSFLRWTFLSSSFYEKTTEPEQRQRNYDKLIVANVD